MVRLTEYCENGHAGFYAKNRYNGSWDVFCGIHYVGTVPASNGPTAVSLVKGGLFDVMLFEYRGDKPKRFRDVSANYILQLSERGTIVSTYKPYSAAQLTASIDQFGTCD
jgi:hypothetical protein